MAVAYPGPGLPSLKLAKNTLNMEVWKTNVFSFGIAFFGKIGALW